MPQSVCRERVSIALGLLSGPEFMNCGFYLTTYMYLWMLIIIFATMFISLAQLGIIFYCLHARGPREIL